jgi:transcriptional regulator with XRE-family HTH domain
MKLADYLARELADNGLSQTQFAKRAGLSPGTISLVKRGLVGISTKTLNKIAAATNGEVDEADYEPLLWGPAE